MVNIDDLVSLSWEDKRRMKSAIDFGYLDDFEENPRAWKRSLVGTLLKRYPRRTATLNRLKDIIGHIPQWEDITDDVLRDFVDDTLDVMAASSAKTICSELKSALNKNKRKIPSVDFADILIIKGEASQAVYLTPAEIQRLMDYRPKMWMEQAVYRNFLVAYMTGARICDAERLTTNNCDIETGTLSYVPKKTPGVVVTVPVHERLNLRLLLAQRITRKPELSNFNETLREMCRKSDIDTLCTIRRRGREETGPKWKFVSSHTARRSFATNLYLAGASLEDIALLMGHGKNIETTKRYICAERTLSSNVMAYFQPTQEEQYQDQEDATFE